MNRSAGSARVALFHDGELTWRTAPGLVVAGFEEDVGGAAEGGRPSCGCR
ncbi:hypothetical protein ACRAWF_05225 [Streptomyces sp. L7]